MRKIEFAEDQAQLFKDSGLESFEDFFDYSKGEMVNANKKRNVLAITLKTGGGQKEFFMKCFFSPHFKDMFFTFQNFGHLCSQAQCEWENANILLANGIDTYRPVCFGFQTVFGVERKSFFVTEKLSGCCLADFVTGNWSKLSHKQKEGLIRSMAKFVRKIHDAKISLPDLYIWHLFVSEKNLGEYDFAVIDLHRMKVDTTGETERARNLGALDFSMSEKYFDEKLRRIFLDAYAGSDYNQDRLWRKMKRRSKILSGRRRRQNY